MSTLRDYSAIHGAGPTPTTMLTKLASSAWALLKRIGEKRRALFGRFGVRGFFLMVLLLLLVFPAIGYGSVESTLSNIQNKLITVILPLAAILGLVFAGLSFVSGSPNARQHLVLAIVGAVIGFGAPSIVTFIRGLVQ